MQRFDKVAIIGRWRPVHHGHAVVLRRMCDCARQVVVCVGSANRYNWRNPFTFEETIAMVRLVLEGRSNVDLVGLDDLDDGPRWRDSVLNTVGPVELLFSANPYVQHLCRGHLPVAHPVSVVPSGDRVAVEGALVRRLMAQGGFWQPLVPSTVVRFIQSQGLDRRFRREFGLETLAMQLVDGGRQDVLVG